MEPEMNGQEDTPKYAPPRGGYIIFFIVLGLAIGKDIFDLFTMFLNLAGMGITATVIGAPVGTAVTMFSEFLDLGAGLIMDFIMLTYFSFAGGRFFYRFVITSISAIIDAVPGVNLLPLTSLLFVLAFRLGRTANKIAASAPAQTTRSRVVQAAVRTFSKS
jgi:hypothetical protein